MSEENTQATPAVDAPVAEEKKEEAQPVVAENGAPEGENVEVPAKFKMIVDGVESLSVLDLHELVKLLEKKFGVSAQAVAVAPAGAAAGAGEEKSSFDVELTDGGASKIAVIKIVKEVLGLGLKEAKDLVDAAPSELKKGMKKEEAEDVKKRIEEAGGKVALK